MGTSTDVICNMENRLYKNEMVGNLMPKFLSYEYVAQNIENTNHEFEFVQLTKDQIKELTINVDKELLSSESIRLLSNENNLVPIEYGSWMYFPIRNKCIQILPKTDFIELRTCRNRLKIKRNEQLELSKKPIAGIGLSAGNVVANALIVILPESWTMSLVKEIQLNLLNHDKKNAKKIQPGIQGQGGFRSCKKSKNACRIEPAF
jgi:hypothetical protein